MRILSNPVERAKASIPSLFDDVYPYPDTAELYFFSRHGLREVMVAFCNRNPDCYKHDALRWDPVKKKKIIRGYRIVLQQPTLDTLRAATRLQAEHKGKLSGVHIAYNFATNVDRIRELSEMMQRGLIFKWRRPGITYQQENGWGSHMFEGQRRKPRNMIFYDDHHCKSTGITEVVHIELRLENTETTRRAGFETPSDLIDANARNLFDHNFRVVDFPAKKYEEFKRRVIRRLVMDRDCYWSADRINAFLDRIYDNGRAMSVKNDHPEHVKRLRTIDMTAMIPVRLSYVVRSMQTLKSLDKRQGVPLCMLRT